MGIAASIGPPNPGNLSWTLDSSSCTELHRGVWRWPGQDVTVLWHRASQSSVQGNGASRWPDFSEMISRLDQNSRTVGSSQWIPAQTNGFKLNLKAVFCPKHWPCQVSFKPRAWWWAKTIPGQIPYSQHRILISLWGLPQKKFSHLIHGQIQARIHFSPGAVKFLQHLSSLHRCPGLCQWVPPLSLQKVGDPQECPLQQRWIFLGATTSTGYPECKAEGTPWMGSACSWSSSNCSHLEKQLQNQQQLHQNMPPSPCRRTGTISKGAWTGLYSVNEFPPNPIETLLRSVYH